MLGQVPMQVQQQVLLVQVLLMQVLLVQVLLVEVLVGRRRGAQQARRRTLTAGALSG